MHHARLSVRGLAPVVFVSGLLIGCLPEEPPAENGAWPPPTSLNLLAAPSTLNLYEVTGSIPESPAGAVLAWLIDSLNVHPEQLTAENVASRFAPSVFEVASAGDLAGQLAEAGRNRPFAFVGLNAPARSNRIVAVIGSTADGYRQLTVETDATGKATVLLFEPLGPASNEAPPEPAPVVPAEGSAGGSGSGAEGSAAPAEGSAPAAPAQ